MNINDVRQAPTGSIYYSDSREGIPEQWLKYSKGWILEAIYDGFSWVRMIEGNFCLKVIYVSGRGCYVWRK